ncbi:OmpH family outer membrane protein [Rhodobacter calidifons]|uniref:OmpH family outer membrane protein n=1 Tax=Rhodobacter calidifons TaxID=2715277 RepID=A0ABX0G9H1_9RHOB|nr:OmpH family outer membrane protein [Rhodobacter calidifons]NHB77356.1 OmpH family outer membrane protein [Rhodobacter calidifons]
MLLGAGAMAQDIPVPAPILTLDQDRLFLESDFGKAVIARERADTSALEQENRRIEAELIAEEQALTEARATLSAEEFSARAAAFDAKVERIRDEQDAKARRLTERRDQDRKAFLEVAVPVLGALLGDSGATVILEKSQVILSLSAVDVTDEAIRRVNAALASPPPAAP